MESGIDSAHWFIKSHPLKFTDQTYIVAPCVSFPDRPRQILRNAYDIDRLVQERRNSLH